MSHTDNTQLTFGDDDTFYVRTGNTTLISAWHLGDECRIDGKDIQRESGKMYDARIVTLARADIGGGRFVGAEVAELHITASATGFDGNPIVQRWTHPKLVPTAKLRKALLK